MINVCTKCLRINPLGLTKCNYCRGNCQEIKPLDFGQFCIEQQKEAKKEEQKQPEDLALESPDLKIFEEYGMMADQVEVILARP